MHFLSALSHLLTQTQALMCESVWHLGALGLGRRHSHSMLLTALSTLSVHLSLCSPLPPHSCSPSRPISWASTHRECGCSALGYLQRPDSSARKHRNSCSLQYVCSTLSSLLLSLRLSLSKSQLIHILMMSFTSVLRQVTVQAYNNGKVVVLHVCYLDS